jgi:hypothetical protein
MLWINISRVLLLRYNSVYELVVCGWFAVRGLSDVSCTCHEM